MQKLFFSITVLFLASLCTTLANSADSSAFDPTKIAVTAKSSGGSVPVGTIIAWPVATNPSDADNWLECNGQYISSAVYPELYAVVGSYVPDYRGMFLRGYGSQKHSQVNGTDINKGQPTETTHLSGNIGEVQGDAMRNIKSSFSARTTGILQRSGAFSFAYRSYNSYAFENTHGGSLVIQDILFDPAKVVPTAEEIRPVNKAVRYLIRAKS